MSESQLGRFLWFDLMTTDPDAAPAFYGAVTGWTTTPFDGAGEPYTMFVNGEQPIGGVMELSAEASAAGAPPHWLAYISTPDIKETVAKAVELGGTVLGEMDVPNVGSFAVLADPQGAVFSAFQPLEPSPARDGGPQVGEFSWHELYTDDWEAVWDFYSTLFGWHTTDQIDMGETGIYQMYGLGEQTLGGMMNRMPDMPPPHWLFYIRVADMDTAVAAVGSAGGKVWNGPMEVPGGDFVAHCFDAQGVAFALHSSTHS